ncbi:MAG: YecA family protein [Alcanivoracaceae bacterium]
MHQPDNPQLRQNLRDWLDNAGDHCLTWVEVHGLLTALACAPRLPEQWQDAILDEGTVPVEVASAMENLRQRIQAQLSAGEGIQLPCRLDPDEEREGKDLASWCAGFVIAVSLDEQGWHGDSDDETMAGLLLPFLLMSGLDEDPALDELWQDRKLVRQMATGIPDLVEELFLHFHAPELADEDSGEDDHDD